MQNETADRLRDIAYSSEYDGSKTAHLVTHNEVISLVTYMDTLEANLEEALAFINEPFEEEDLEVFGDVDWDEVTEAYDEAWEELEEALSDAGGQ